MHKNAMKCNKTQSKWCINKHGASKIIDTFETYQRAKDWLLSLPRNSIDSWVKCKDAFIGKYYPPAKIISLRSDIMKFK
jgi:hypothetical protein